MTELVDLDWVIWHVTNRCNLSCSYCLTGSGPTAADGPSFPNLLEIARFISEARLGLVTIIGGEPFMIRGLPDITILLLTGGTRVNIDTNGLYCEARWSDVYTSPQVTLTISLDGPQAIHDATRGAYAATTKAMSFVARSGGKLACSVTVTSLNAVTLIETALTAADLGATAISLNRVRPIGRAIARGFKSPLSVDLEERVIEQALELQNLLTSRSIELSVSGIYDERLFRSGLLDELPLCMCGHAKATIWIDGKVFPCESIPLLFNESALRARGLDFPSVNCRSWKEILDSPSFSSWRHTVLDKPPECHSCRFRRYCSSGCRALALASAGDTQRKDSECRIAG